MNYPTNINIIKTKVQWFYLLDQYKTINICSYFTNSGLVLLWIYYNYSRFYNYSTICNSVLLSNKSLCSKNILHVIWLNTSWSKKYSVILKKNTNINYISILPRMHTKQSFKKLYITTLCYNINRLVNSTSNTNSLSTAAVVYCLKLLRDNNLFLYRIGLHYLHYFNTLRNIPLIKLLGLKQSSVITSTKRLMNNLLINHNLKNL
jgi:hypothetical protein